MVMEYSKYHFSGSKHRDLKNMKVLLGMMEEEDKSVYLNNFSIPTFYPDILITLSNSAMCKVVHRMMQL